VALRAFRVDMPTSGIKFALPLPGLGNSRASLGGKFRVCRVWRFEENRFLVLIGERTFGDVTVGMIEAWEL